jgi:hypothetical protein
MEESMSKPKGKIGKLIMIIVILVVVVGIVWFVWGRISPATTSGAYQAVFLSNGQVYFGKVSNLHSDYVKLADIFYLQMKKGVQTQEPPAEGEQPAAAQSQLSLIKLGSELHGPQDSMIINQKHVLFIESLKDDSKVVAAIKQYQDKQAADAAKK